MTIAPAIDEPVHIAPSSAAATPEGGEAHPPARLLATEASDADRMVALGMHLWWLGVLLPIGPLAVGIPIALWLWKKDSSRWLDDQGREVINFGLSQAILTIGLTLTIVGVVALPVLWVVGVVGVVRGAIAAGRREYFRYPMTFRML